MSYKKTTLITFILLYAINCFAQETVEKSNRINDNVTETFQVLKENRGIKNGLYMAFYNRKHLLARGMYTMGKRSGRWHYFDPKGRPMQIYDYNTDSLKYEARDGIGGNISYLIDKNVSDTDHITKPVKAGGRYYGYLPYLSFYKTPFSPMQYSTYGAAAVIELLVSPMGRLADFKIHVQSDFLGYNQTVSMDMNLLKEEDRKFIPATYNGEPILSRIVIRCRVTDDGGLDFYYNAPNSF
jgi:hypothetical protein